jgi:hypothetical protein
MALCKVSNLTREAVGALVCGLAVAPVVVSTLWLLLATARTRTTLLAASATLTVAVSLVLQYAGFRVAGTGAEVATTTLAWYLALVLSLAWFRVGGWRLARPIAASPAHHPIPNRTNQ